MNYKCVIFDVDGTLLDSLPGILKAVNLSFKDNGYNVERTIEEAKEYIGAGTDEFLTRAMSGVNASVEMHLKMVQDFFKHYLETQKTYSIPYNGIIDLLEELNKQGVKVCVASNKAQALLEPIMEQCFPTVKFDIILGYRKDKPEKPDPFILFEIMEKFNLKVTDCIYVGDSEYDYLTAHNAGMDCIIVKYGYGYYDESWMNKITKSVNNVEELKKLL